MQEAGEYFFRYFFMQEAGEYMHLKFAQWDVTGYLARPWHGQGQT